MSQEISQAVILAGGLGTRLRPLTDTIPKPMINLAGKPFLEHLIALLVGQGIDRVLILAGYKAEVIQDHFQDGTGFGCQITYSITDVENDTGRRVKLACDQLDEDFLLLYCDNYWPLSLPELINFRKMRAAEALVTVFSNNDRSTRDNLRLGQDGFVELYDKSRTSANLAGVDIGFMLLKRKHIESFPDDNVSLEQTLYPKLIARRQLVGFRTHHKYYSVGSLERLPLTEDFLAFKPAVLLDRDGVLNQRQPKGQYLTRWEDWQWMPGVLEGLRLYRDAGFRTFVITNQAGIGRGIMTREAVDAIHSRMIEDAAQAGGQIDGVYMCPHHWDDNCDCRKPKPGMLFQAQRDHHLDLSRTTFIGDDERDGEAARAALCPFVLADENFSFLRTAEDIIQHAA